MTIEPIAIFHSPFGGKFGIPRQSNLVDEIEGEIRFLPDYSRPEALKGLEGFDYLWIIWEFSANRGGGKWQSVVRPPRLGGNATMGVFATRSPYRPNPLGLSCVRISHVDTSKMIIKVKGADLMDGTPIYDIKPYVPYADSHPDARSGFVGESDWHGLDVVFPEELSAGLDPKEVAAIRGVIAQDPRPHYQRDHTRVYGFDFNGKDVRFTVSDDDVATVVEILK